MSHRDLENAIHEDYTMALAGGPSHEAAFARAAAFPLIRREQIMYPAVSTEIVKLRADAKEAGSEGPERKARQREF